MNSWLQSASFLFCLERTHFSSSTSGKMILNPSEALLKHVNICELTVSIEKLVMCSTSMGLPHSAEVADCFGSPTCVVLCLCPCADPFLRLVANPFERLSSLLRLSWIC